jgi:hypothetical protein
MSWDADFDGSWWNYTHNTNRMIAAAFEAMTGVETKPSDFPILGEIIGPTWWDRLNGKSGTEGAEYLSLIITGLEADPARYRAMNPDNGWGDYDGVLKVLREMYEASRQACCDARKWHVSG